MRDKRTWQSKHLSKDSLLMLTDADAAFFAQHDVVENVDADRFADVG
jgi:hypothetical protein